MRCKQIRKKLFAFRNNELTRVENEKIERHLEICPHCQSEYKAMINTIETLKALPDLETSSGFNLRLTEKIISLGVRPGEEKAVRYLLRNWREYLIFSPEKLWPKVAAGILTILFLCFAQLYWTAGALNYPLAKGPAIKNFGLKEISLTYNFLKIGVENRDGNINLKVQVGS